MAARRLLVVMLVLLGISTLAALLVPSPTEREREETAATTTPATTEAPAAKPREGAAGAAGGERLEAQIEVGGEKIPVVPVAVGDQLTLKIRSRRRGLLEIPALGRVEAVAPGTPAFFYLLARERASYGIRFVGAERIVARIEVEPASRGRARAE